MFRGLKRGECLSLKLFLFAFLILLWTACCADTQSSGEGAFVEKLEGELWHLSQMVTKYSEIKAKYRSLNARVDRNDGRNLTGQIADNVGEMLKMRTDAVKCIQERAEGLVYNSDPEPYNNNNFSLEYFNMQWSGRPSEELPWVFEDDTTNYTDLTFQRNTHFYGIPVNTEETAVHIPTNLYDRYPDVAEAIDWSAALTETFISNYNSNPQLSWQYFGAISGMMRQFPAMRWRSEHEISKEKKEKADLYDCRTRDWFIEAATCSKDVVILMDVSGSTSGLGNSIAKLVVKKVLTTLSNNDFVNVLFFNWTVQPAVKCFDELVQANYENIKDLQAGVDEIKKPTGNASVPNAFKHAFQLLEKAREKRGCDDNSTDCQQVVMLVTDGLPGNITHVFEEYNRLPDGTPRARVFTYLLGLEVRGVSEIQDIACENRGYYVHITALDQVQDKVLKYMEILARPLALQAEEHPVRWTHLFSDIDDRRVNLWLKEVMSQPQQQARLAQHELYIKSQYFRQEREDAKYLKKVEQVEGEEKETTYQEYQLMTSVSIPVYDNRDINLYETKSPHLLAGVAGTDVPISDIYQLTYPYKIGANGYAFIVTNNGHILMHPDHRPVHKGFLKPNYNSVDLLDVEFAVDEDEFDNLTRLRDCMVENIEGVIEDVMVKFHYDDMRRVGVEKRSYFFQPLIGTPFALGLAIPSDYGDYQIGVKDMVNERFLMTTQNPLEAFFWEPEWRLHPEWTYCKYRFRDHRHFNTSEEEFLDIIRLIKTQSDWKMHLEWWASAERQHRESDTCSKPVVDKDDYYCDSDLLILLIFDANVTNDTFRDPVIARNKYEEKLLKSYNTTLRFAATQSGLTRWQKIPKPAANDTDRGDFGDIFPRAIDEPWFKAAVLQYNLDQKAAERDKSDQDSFVFSVPFDAGVSGSKEFSITAVISIFPRDGGRKAPASVVGFQLTYESFENHFHELAKNFSTDLNSDNRYCYIIDHNAYIVLSHDVHHVGKPFVSVESKLMSKLIAVDMFTELFITDYQSLIINVSKEDIRSSASRALYLSWHTVVTVASWIWTHIFLTWMHALAIPVDVSGVHYSDYMADMDVDDEDDDEDDDDINDNYFNGKTPQKPIKVEESTVQKNETNKKKIVQHGNLRYTNHTMYLLGLKGPKIYIRPIGDTDSKLISARRIGHTNLVLVVVDRLLHDENDENKATGSPLPETEPTACLRYSRTKDLRRRFVDNCTTSHPQEDEIDACGGSGKITISIGQVIPFVTLLSLIQLFSSY